MSDTFPRSCGPSTWNGYIRGTDETLTENEDAGAPSTTRSEVARGWGEPSGGGTSSRRIAPDGDALGACSARRRHGGITPGAALRTPGAAQRGTTPGVGAAAQRRGAGGRLFHGVMDRAADRATDRDEVLRETGSD